MSMIKKPSHVLVALAFVCGISVLVSGQVSGPSFPPAGAPMVLQPGSAVTAAGTVQSGQLLFPDGTSLLPSIAFASEPTLGFWRSAAATVNFVGTKLNVTLVDSTTGTLTLGGTSNVSVNGGITVATNVFVGATGSWGTTSKGRIQSLNDGQFTLQNNGLSLGSTVKVDALPTVASGFGTGPAITAGSTPFAGSINVGTVTPGTGGVINFNGTAFPSAPFVVCQDDTSLIAVRCTATTTQMTITAVALTASDVVSWIAVSSK